MSRNKLPPFKLFSPTVLEPRDEQDALHQRCFELVSALTADKGEKEAHEALAAAASKDPKTHEDICIGLLVGCLGDVEAAARHFRDLTLVARDGMTIACNHLTHLVLEKYPRMVIHVKQQLLWLTKEMIKASVNSIETICWNLMRQIAGGNVSQPNLWLADSLLDIFIENRAWLEKFSFLLASVVYTYLRVIEDHYHLHQLRDKEVRFVVSLMRDRFADVIVIGRDLVRVLQQVAKIPEFAALWNDILMHPKSLSPTFNGITQLMRTRTSRRFLQSRITHEMEKKLVFLTSQVRFGHHKRYQDWFQRQYLSTTESQSLRCDLIRFIVGVIHPTNELLGSDVIPRWAVIGWLLTTCTNQVASSNAKLALFYDWLYFTPEKDNIMNIEPAILVMHHSLKPHPAITATLLDFLCRIIANFYPRESEKVRQGIYASLNTIVEKRVLPSLVPLFDNPRLDNELRKMLRERFAPVVFGIKDEGSNMGVSAGAVPSSDDLIPPVLKREDDDGARFSDDDEEETNATPVAAAAAEDDDVDEDEALADSRRKRAGSKKKKGKDKGKTSSSSSTSVAASSQSDAANNSNESTYELDDELKEIISELKTETDLEKRCDVMDKLIQAISSDDRDLEFEQCSTLASSLGEALSDEFEGKIFPSEDPSPENVEDSIGRPLFVVFRSLCELSDHDSRKPILTTLAELYTLQPRVGYYLLYFLCADRCSAAASERRTAKEKAAVYKELCEAIDAKYSLDICLVNDMRQCQEDDVNMFVYLVPEIFANFPKHSVGNVDLLYLVVSCVDGRQVQTLVCHIVAKDIVMFKKDSFKDVLTSSLTWETFEQYALWHLAAAHDLPVECVISVVPRLSFSKHAEALTSILLLLKDERPTSEIIKQIFAKCCEPRDTFVTSALTSWLGEFDDVLADLISSLLCKQASLPASSSTSAKRKRGGQSAGGPGSGMNGGSLSHPAELCLLHLDQLRQKVANHPKHADFFSHDSIQSALHTVRQSCTESQKAKFSDLFALADSDSESEESSPPQKTSGKKKSSANSSTKSPGKNKRNAAAVVSSDGSSDDSDKEVVPSKKRSGGGSRGGGKKPSRKRAKDVSYKVYSDQSSDEDDVVRKAPKKKKKPSSAANSDSD